MIRHILDPDPGLCILLVFNLSWKWLRIKRFVISGFARIRIDFGRMDPEIVGFEVLDALFWGLKALPVAWTSFIEV